jgi:hypothetical protein
MQSPDTILKGKPVMKFRSPLVQAVSSILVALWVKGSFSEEPKMYLCSDSLSRGKAKEKTVYGFINGKQTACMSEFEFLALYSQAQFEKDSSARQKEERDAFKQAKESIPKTALDSLVVKIRSGLKDLGESDLMGADLEGCDLRNAKLKSADLRGAKLRMADLMEADLEAAYLRRADLRGAVLDGAKLRGTFFGEADLRGASGLSVEHLKNVATLYNAKLDDELKKEVEKEIPEKLIKPKKCWENNAWSDNDDCDTDKPYPKAE